MYFYVHISLYISKGQLKNHIPFSLNRTKLSWFEVYQFSVSSDAKHVKKCINFNALIVDIINLVQL